MASSSSQPKQISSIAVGERIPGGFQNTVHFNEKKLRLLVEQMRAFVYDRTAAEEDERSNVDGLDIAINVDHIMQLCGFNPNALNNKREESARLSKKRPSESASDVQTDEKRLKITEDKEVNPQETDKAAMYREAKSQEEHGREHQRASNSSRAGKLDYRRQGNGYGTSKGTGRDLAIGAVQFGCDGTGKQLAEQGTTRVDNRNEVWVDGEIEGVRSGFKWFATFYFTNFPKQIRHFYLGKAFEFRIWAQVARFDKAHGGEKEKGVREQGGKDIGSNGGVGGRGNRGTGGGGAGECGGSEGERGDAWVRLYGIPLHAWTVDFFKLCVMDCGRYLRMDECTMERDRHDYARMLVATSSVEVLNLNANILVDEVMVEIKVIEEWGFNLGEDACLVEEEDQQELLVEQVGEQSDHELSNHVDMLVEKLADEMVGVKGELHVDPDKPLGDAGAADRDACGDTQVDPPVLRGDTIHELHVSDRESKRKKVGGVLRHTVQTLKRVARLHGGERREVASVNKDWENWMVMHEDEKVAVEDVWGIGEAIRIKVKGVSANMFSVLSMGARIVSWNVRGLGGLEKRREFRKLISENNPFIVCIQETKLGACDDLLCASMWGSTTHGYSFRPSVGASGGILVMWDTEEVEVWSTVSHPHVLMIHGRFIRAQEEFFLFNVYAPCENNAKVELWNRLTRRLLHLGWQKVCDFNAVQSDAERRSVLVSEDWCLVWPNCVQQAQLRGLSDYCPLSLSVDEENWGEEDGLTEDEIAKLHAVSSDIHSLIRMNTSICWQQARLLWLHEGDINSKGWRACNPSAKHCSHISLPISRQDTWTGRGWMIFSSVLCLRPKEGVWLNLFPSKKFMPQYGIVIAIRVSFHRNGKLVKGINSTFIALIPKVDNPKKLNDFRPISLVGSLYKILAKVIANRLQQVVGSVVSEVQSAFVAERQILDGILVVNEVVDDARRHQGLNVMMWSLVQAKLFTGYSIGTGSLIDISHLQFADDTLLLGVKSWANICALRGILVLFELVSGLKVNFHKSMLVGVNVAESWLASNGNGFGLFGVRTGENFLGFVGVMYGGLGVRQMRAFNTALLGKWCWRMLVDKSGLWYLLLAARYGEEAGRVLVCVCVWGRGGVLRGGREIARIKDGEGDEGEGGGLCKALRGK
ncbi:hypothetical protein TSUD_398680 [Trifolium subterraneum]|uniref:Endonuclease/exonuclease/phosphatase domain-containing protein n=1 Tax=Trifolium subterraneum TaxID=3900 RepID=A0A2Z6P2K6_TRISU|nr:hypothetical protein TSUD_398680 [Trifolium subterraneum]